MTLAPVQAHARRGRVRIWLPIPALLLWLLVAPVALIALPVMAIARQPRGISPFAVIGGVGRVLFALNGTVVDVECPDVRVRIRIF